jgi:hypothetical protein
MRRRGESADVHASGASRDRHEADGEACGATEGDG